MPVAGGAGILYVDTKYGWGFNDKQQKWIKEFAELLGELLKNREAAGREENYARIFDVLRRLDEVAFKGYALDSYCELFVTEWSQLLGTDYGFLVLKGTREEKFSHPGLHGKYAKRPGHSEFSRQAGADRLDLAKSRKTCSSSASIPTHRTISFFRPAKTFPIRALSGECPARLPWDMNLP